MCHEEFSGERGAHAAHCLPATAMDKLLAWGALGETLWGSTAHRPEPS